MTTLDDVLDIQQKQNILQAPTVNVSTKSALVKSFSTAVSEGTATTSSTFTLSLYNSSTSSSVYAYVVGLAIDKSNAVVLIESDGVTQYYPSSPSSTIQPLAVNCAIPLGAPGTTKSVTIPYIAGGRVYFSVGTALTFYLNPGPALVEPSISNPSDANYNLSWDFCEFTYNSSQMFMNISYVDFVSLPISLTLTGTAGNTTHVSGIPSNGLTTICNSLTTQSASDGGDWKSLIIKNSSGTILRAISPDQAITMNSSLFQNYWTTYINSCWAYYQTTTLTVDTQVSWGTLTGTSDGTNINFSGVGSFAKPAAIDIFGANSGPFSGSYSAEIQNIGARINAAINRGTFMSNTKQPDNEVVSTFYQNSICNHYCGIVHSANLDGLGYAMPYDDVYATNGVNQCGAVADGSPATLVISMGGTGAYARRRNVNMETREKARRLGRRDMGGWLEDVKEPIAMSDANRNIDLEMGDRKLINESSQFAAGEVAVRRFKLPAAVEKVVGPCLEKFYASPFYQQYLLPFLILLHQFIVAALSLSIRTVISRVFIVLCFFLFYFLGLLQPGQNGQAGIVDGAVQGRVMETSVTENLTMLVQGGAAN